MLFVTAAVLVNDTAGFFRTGSQHGILRSRCTYHTWYSIAEYSVCLVSLEVLN